MTETVCCKRCGSDDGAKNGHTRGMQRYRCRNCGASYTPSPRRGVDPAKKALAIVLYAFAGASMGKIARLCGVSTVAVLKWMRAAGLAAGLPDPAAASDIVMIDEMWHFVNGKKTRFGSGGPWTGRRVRLSDGNSALVAMPSRGS